MKIYVYKYKIRVTYIEINFENVSSHWINYKHFMFYIYNIQHVPNVCYNVSERRSVALLIW